MTAPSGTTPAVGGERHVPVPDPIAREYLLLALRLDQRIPGIVDGYYGPADLKAQVDMEPVRSPSSLAADARSLHERAADPALVDDPLRRRWLTAQAVALEANALSLTEDGPSYPTLVERSFDFTPQRRYDAEFREAAAAVDAILPGAGSAAERLAELDARFELRADVLPRTVDALIDRFRARSGSMFGLPEGEHVRVGLVRNQPWSGYNWYDGGLRSRVDVNVDLPTSLPRLIHLVAHEAYPGHHLEHAWKEADLVARGCLEASVLLLNAPEGLISEGLADVGDRFVAPEAERVRLILELAAVAGLPLAADPGALRDATERIVALAPHRQHLGWVDGEAAMRRHADGAGRDEVLAYLVEVGLMAPERAAKRLDFIENPISRTYVHIYAAGADLLERWLALVPSEQQAARFGRLLHEQLTPGAIRDEIARDGPPVVPTRPSSSTGSSALHRRDTDSR